MLRGPGEAAGEVHRGGWRLKPGHLQFLWNKWAWWASIQPWYHSITTCLWNILTHNSRGFHHLPTDAILLPILCVSRPRFGVGPALLAPLRADGLGLRAGAGKLSAGREESAAAGGFSAVKKQQSDIMANNGISCLIMVNNG